MSGIGLMGTVECSFNPGDHRNWDLILAFETNVEDYAWSDAVWNEWMVT